MATHTQLVSTDRLTARLACRRATSLDDRNGRSIEQTYAHAVTSVRVAALTATLVDPAVEGLTESSQHVAAIAHPRLLTVGLPPAHQ